MQAEGHFFMISFVLLHLIFPLCVFTFNIVIDDILFIEVGVFWVFPGSPLILFTIYYEIINVVPGLLREKLHELKLTLDSQVRSYCFLLSAIDEIL